MSKRFDTRGPNPALGEEVASFEAASQAAGQIWQELARDQGRATLWMNGSGYLLALWPWEAEPWRLRFRTAPYRWRKVGHYRHLKSAFAAVAAGRK